MEDEEEDEEHERLQHFWRAFTPIDLPDPKPRAKRAQAASSAAAAAAVISSTNFEPAHPGGGCSASACRNRHAEGVICLNSLLIGDPGCVCVTPQLPMNVLLESPEAYVARAVALGAPPPPLALCSHDSVSVARWDEGAPDAPDADLALLRRPQRDGRAQPNSLDRTDTTSLALRRGVDAAALALQDALRAGRSGEIEYLRYENKLSLLATFALPQPLDPPAARARTGGEAIATLPERSVASAPRWALLDCTG